MSTAVEEAEANGHEMEWDPPAALTAAERWTCKSCGATALDYRGTVYGEAVEKTHDEVIATWKRLGYA
jgi:hypothetical protein